MSYLILAIKPGRTLRPVAHSVSAAAMAARFFRDRGWAVTILNEVT